MGLGAIHRPEEEGKLRRRLDKIVGKGSGFRKSGSKADSAGGGTSPSGGKNSKEAKTKSNVKPEKPVQMAVRVATPLFVQATPDGILAARLREEVERMASITGWKYNVVE